MAKFVIIVVWSGNEWNQKQQFSDTWCELPAVVDKSDGFGVKFKFVQDKTVSDFELSYLLNLFELCTDWFIILVPPRVPEQKNFVAEQNPGQAMHYSYTRRNVNVIYLYLSVSDIILDIVI